LDEGLGKGFGFPLKQLELQILQTGYQHRPAEIRNESSLPAHHEISGYGPSGVTKEIRQENQMSTSRRQNPPRRPIRWSEEHDGEREPS
jgi:hypothetical protein